MAKEVSETRRGSNTSHPTHMNPDTHTHAPRHSCTHSLMYTLTAEDTHTNAFTYACTRLHTHTASNMGLSTSISIPQAIRINIFPQG